MITHLAEGAAQRPSVGASGEKITELGGNCKEMETMAFTLCAACEAD